MSKEMRIRLSMDECLSGVENRPSLDILTGIDSNAHQPCFFAAAALKLIHGLIGLEKRLLRHLLGDRLTAAERVGITVNAAEVLCVNFFEICHFLTTLHK